ncbi:multidrug ABC transporter ATP-binding protein [Candidatus Bathyarchaeota archaeon]|jgi:ATP-binding cassette subfamily B protein|nr:multidrug ABC transporter ATP-binding protein [Candidatus Bathyarchaeota archaeon]
MGDFGKVLKYLYPHKKEAIIASVMLAFVVIADLSIPRMVQTIIDNGVAQQDMNIILWTSLSMIGASVLSAALSIANTYYSVKASRGFEADLREAIFKKIQTFSFGNLDDLNTGQLLTRLTSDLNMIQTVVSMGLRMFTRAPLMFLGSYGIMFATNPSLALVILALLPVTLVLLLFFIRLLRPLFSKVQERLDYLNQVLQENLTGIRVVKAFVRSDHENQRFEKANTELFEISLKMTQYISTFFPIIITLMNLGTVAIIYYGGLQVFTGTTSVGQIMAFTNYLFATMFPVLMLAMMAAHFSGAGASATRIMEVVNSVSEVQDSPDAVSLDDIRGRVAFENVTFSYRDDGGDPVLTGISFTAEPGEKVALLGQTGSGKSSLINLIPRFYDTSGGRVTVDGVDVKDIKIYNLRGHIGISLQEAILFSGTIRDNIKYGKPDASEEEMLEVAKIAQAHDFIMAFPEGYDTIVEQRGVNLSGGQKQRLAIARVLLVKPKILILDDSTSAVDVETEAEIENALESLLGDTTSFIVAQRISTVLKADKILVLDDGKIAAEGRHAELMDTSSIYQEIFESQLGDGGAED